MPREFLVSICDTQVWISMHKHMINKRAVRDDEIGFVQEQRKRIE
jgi:hypothetical protein